MAHAASVPDRLRAWATLSLPFRVVVSPAVDWRTGFPYSLQDERMLFEQFRENIGVEEDCRLGH